MEKIDELRDKFNELVNNYNLSIQKIAEESGINHQTLYHFKENARNPQNKTIERIINYINNFDKEHNLSTIKYENKSFDPDDALTINQAKLALSKSLGVPPEKIKIFIEG